MVNKKINEFLKKGKIFYDSDKYKNSLSNYQKSLKLDPNNLDGLIGKGKALLALGRNKKALECFNKSLKIEPSNSDALHYKGHVSDELEKFEDAIIYYEKAYEINKDARIPSHIGFCYYNIDKWKEAISWFDKALEEDSNDPDLWHYKAHSLQELNEYDGTIQCFTKAYELDKNTHFLTQIGWSYYHLNQYEKALEYVNRAIKVNPRDTEALVTKSRIIGLRNPNQANDLLETAIKIDKNDPDAWEVKGNLLWMGGKEEDAKKCFAKIKGKRSRYKKPKEKKEKTIEELLKSSETIVLEFKSSLSYPYDAPSNLPQDAFRKKRKEVEDATLKTIVGFLNTNGGELIIGVSDKKDILGLDKDYEILGFDNCSNPEKLDRWRQYLDNLIRDRIDKDVSSNYIAVRNEERDGKMLARVVMKKSSKPQFLYDNNKDHCTFFIRNNSGTQMLNTKYAYEYIMKNFNTEGS